MHSFAQAILEGEVIPEEESEALLILIPKDSHPSAIRSFRPISLCNVSMKLISKMVVKRLKEVWKCIISPFQSSFVPARQGIENVIIYHELIHSLCQSKSRKGG